MSNAVAQVQFWGATQTVTGSMHQVFTPSKTLLLDCGLYQGRRSETFARNRSFPFKAKSIDAVILSHAHIDHCGNLPNLVKRGFSGPIYCTSATRSLAAVMLEDSAKIQLEDAEYLNQRRGRGEPRIEPIYDDRDVHRTLHRLQAVRYGARFDIGKGVEATFHDAGHLLGSATVHLKITTDAGVRNLCFTGDLGRKGLPILRDPEALPACDFLISESTYGGHTHEPVEETAANLGAVVARTVARGGKVLIPAFAVGRSQTILYFLHQLEAAGQLPKVPIFVDSPMATKASRVFAKHPECFDRETLDLMLSQPDLFGGKRVQYLESVHDSMRINHFHEPCIIIAASGMCEAGRILHHLKHNLDDPKNTVLIVGFQAENTLGRRIVERHPEVRVLGKTVPLRAEVVVLNGLSSHADHGDLMEMLGPLAGKTERVRLVHGEPSRAAALADALGKVGFKDVAVPAHGDTAPI